MKKEMKNIQKALMTGVSYMLPFVVAGGILMAISFLGGTPTETGYVITNSIMQNLNVISKAGMAMMVPALGGYIAYAIGGRPALAPGFILGFLANNPVGNTEIKAGFIGALLMGIVVGYLVNWCKSWKVPNMIKSILPILIIPTFVTLVAGMIYVYIVSGPIISLSNTLMNFLTDLSGSNLILFAIIVGLVCEIDMGGPLTKTVTLFTIALMADGNFVANGIYRVCPAIPPLAILISNYLFKNKWSQVDRTAAQSAGIMGFMGITEGAIPFLVKDIKAILPGSMIGCTVGAVIAALGGVESPVPHGGFITTPVITNAIWYVVAMVVGAFVGAIIIGLLKKPIEEIEQRN
jgi:PTS system fructose-specific IIC component/fructose-specific PTS system IIC-like component